MKVDTMRRIDHLAGVPLCGLLSGWLRLWRYFRPAEKKAPRRVLLIELSEMGSTLLADPAMQKLKRELNAELYFVIFAKNAPSLYLLDTIPRQNIFMIREASLLHLAADTLAFLRWSRKMGIDSVIDLELFSRYTALLAGLCGAVNRVGFHAFHNEGLYRGEMLTHRVAYNPHQHIAKNFIALVNALLSKQEECPYSKTIISDDEIQLRKVSVSTTQQSELREQIKHCFPAWQPTEQRLVLINPNASELLPQRRWMPERYVALMKMILETFPDVVILITGAPSEQQEAEALRTEVGNERCVNFAGQLKLGELPALYSIATLMVTNDSGPGHFSAITDLPVFVLFGPETPALYGSLGNSTPIYAGLACSPCVSAANHRKTPCSDNRCLQAIQPQQVFYALRPVLDKK